MSPDLIAFLKAWHDWATSGAPDGEPFRRCHGLCVSSILTGVPGEVRREMETLFGRSPCPFGAANYERRYALEAQHECPKRLAWVRERLVEAGELVA